MVIYVTSVSKSYRDMLRHARRWALNKGSGMARVLTMPGHMTPRAQVEWAQKNIVEAPEWSSGPGYLLVPSTYELPILRALAALRKQYEDTPQAFEVSTEFTVHCLAMPVEGGTWGKRANVWPLRVERRGEFLDVWPEGFFDERTHELF